MKVVGQTLGQVLGQVLVPAALVLIAIGPMIFVQPALARTTHGIKETQDVSLLPPSSEIRALSLGYRDAAVDLLWSQLLVQYGIRWHEKRPFPAASQYLDALIALDPDYRPTYRYADTILFYHPGGTPNASDVALVRKYVEMGLRQHPDNGQLWMQYGQFLAFIAKSVMPPDQVDAIRADGARAMEMGIEQGADAERVLTVATVLDSAGARSAAIDALERSYALTDDPATRNQIAARVSQLRGSQLRDEAERQTKAVEALWVSDFEFLSRGEYVLIAPMPNVAACAGPSHAGAPACAFDWPSALRGEPAP